MALAESIWSETALISIQAWNTGENLRFMSLTSDISITEGDKEFDQLVMLNGARLIKKTPQGPIEITMTMYPVDVKNVNADATASLAIAPLFDNTESNWPTENTCMTLFSRNRETFRIAILWTDDTAATDAYKATATSNSLRYIVVNAYCVQHNIDYTGDGLKVTAKFKSAPFDTSGNSNRMIQSSAAAMTTLCTAWGSRTADKGKWWWGA